MYNVCVCTNNVCVKTMTVCHVYRQCELWRVRARDMCTAIACPCLGVRAIPKSNPLEVGDLTWTEVISVDEETIALTYVEAKTIALDNREIRLE